MSAAATAACIEDHISKRNFDQLARFIYDYSGIKMPPTKLTMLEGRLRRRLRATGISSFDDYCDYLFKHDGLEQEKVYLIDAVTTNKTDFFTRTQPLLLSAGPRPSEAGRPRPSSPADLEFGLLDGCRALHHRHGRR